MFTYNRTLGLANATPYAEQAEDEARVHVLWLSVIQRAALDAEETHWLKAALAARRWLTMDSPDLQYVSYMAGQETEKVLGRFRKLYGRDETKDDSPNESIPGSLPGAGV